LPQLSRPSGHKLKIEYATAGVVEQKVAANDEIDVAILTKPRIDKLVREAKIVGGTASAQIGVAVTQKGFDVDRPRFTVPLGHGVHPRQRIR
jgi:hypothetical protein